MRVMDAGVRDNYGYRTTFSFLHTFRDWIATNTSGVVILQLRDTQKELEVKPSGGSLFGRIFDPIGSVYDNFVRVQDQDYDLLLKLTGSNGPVPMQVIDFQLKHDDDEQISLSWHLTKVERSRVIRSVNNPENRIAFTLLQQALRPNVPVVLAADASAPSLAGDRAQRP